MARTPPQFGSQLVDGGDLCLLFPASYRPQESYDASQETDDSEVERSLDDDVSNDAAVVLPAEDEPLPMPVIEIGHLFPSYRPHQAAQETARDDAARSLDRNEAAAEQEDDETCPDEDRQQKHPAAKEAKDDELSAVDDASNKKRKASTTDEITQQDATKQADRASGSTLSRTTRRTLLWEPRHDDTESDNQGSSSDVEANINETTSNASAVENTQESHGPPESAIESLRNGRKRKSSDSESGPLGNLGVAASSQQGASLSTTAAARGRVVSWEQRYNELKAYKEANGDCMVSSSDGMLGKWVSNQRTAYQYILETKKPDQRPNGLTHERIDNLPQDERYYYKHRLLPTLVSRSLDVD